MLPGMCKSEITVTSLAELEIESWKFQVVSKAVFRKAFKYIMSKSYI
jgi:hypothetical protein